MQEGADAWQGPVSPYDHFRTLSWGLGIHATVRSSSQASLSTSASDTDLPPGAAEPWQYGSGEVTAGVYLGDQQVGTSPSHSSLHSLVPGFCACASSNFLPDVITDALSQIMSVRNAPAAHLATCHNFSPLLAMCEKLLHTLGACVLLIVMRLPYSWHS